MNTYYAEEIRERLVKQEADRLYEEYLTCLTAFDELEPGYEFLQRNASNISRALRNLDGAIAGKEYARDALFTALSYIQDNLRKHCEEMADRHTTTVHELACQGE